MNLIIGTESIKEIGIYTVLGESEQRANDGHKLHVVKCNECGFTFITRLTHIRDTKFCKHILRNGCFVDRSRRWTNKRLKTIYHDMIDRCCNPNCKDYERYGGRGIKICKDWFNSSENFENWALSKGYTDQLTIDRINPDGDYEPNNCRWITMVNNSKYKSTTTLLDVDGIIHTGREWSEVLHLGTNTVNTYLRKYPEDTVKEFIRRRLDNPNITRKSKQTWLDAYGLS